MTKKPHSKKSKLKIVSTEVEVQLLSPIQETKLKDILARIRQAKQKQCYEEQESLFPKLPPAA
jgi:hypothetical protein